MPTLKSVVKDAVGVVVVTALAILAEHYVGVGAAWTIVVLGCLVLIWLHELHTPIRSTLARWSAVSIAHGSRRPVISFGILVMIGALFGGTLFGAAWLYASRRNKLEATEAKNRTVPEKAHDSPNEPMKPPAEAKKEPAAVPKNHARPEKPREHPSPAKPPTKSLPTVPIEAIKTLPRTDKSVALGENYPTRDSLDVTNWGGVFEKESNSIEDGKFGWTTSVFVWPEQRTSLPVTIRVWFKFNLYQTAPKFESATGRAIKVSSWSVAENGVTFTIEAGESDQIDQNERVRITVRSPGENNYVSVVRLDREKP